MKASDLFFLARKDLGSFKLRSSLIILVISMGILSSTINLYSVSKRIDELIKTFSQMGSNLISIWVQDENITLDKLSFLSNYFPNLSYNVETYKKIKYIRKEKDVVIIGTNPEYKLTNSVKLERGRFLYPSDLKEKRRVCCLAEDLANSLKAKMGGRIKIENDNFRIIGIFREGALSARRQQQMAMLIPISVFNEIVEKKGMPSMIIPSFGKPEIVSKQIEKMLKKRFPSQKKAKRLRRERFFVVGAEGLREVVKQQEFIGRMTILGIGLVTLLLAGGGIINLIMLSVRQRYKEIGIMRAMGAKRDDIFYLFLIEGFLLSLYGLLLGGFIGLCYVALKGGARLDLFFKALLYSSIICFPLSLCGYWPSSLASRISPCEAMRA
ncbi:MAG: ABC transporter permease [bacterium]